jgi:hypothetical protein
MRSVRLLAATACALTLGAAPAVASTAASDTAAHSTKITFTMANCDGCTITPVQAIEKINSRGHGVGVPPVAHTYATVTVHHGKAVAHVPTWHTSGMAFIVTGPHGEAIFNAQSVAVLRYEGRAPGAKVTTYGALRSKVGSWCWGGTTKSTASIDLSFHTFRGTGTDSLPTTFYTFWASPGLHVWGGRNMQATYHAGLGEQDEPWCTKVVS